MTPLELKLLYGDESSIVRLTTSAPPVVLNITEHRTSDGRAYWEGDPEGEPADRVGQNLSAALVSLISGVIEAHDSDNCEECIANPLLAEQTTSYGPRHPIRRALAGWETVCRRRHRPPTAHDHFNGPICSDMLRAVVEHGASVLWCSQKWGLSYTRAEQLIYLGAAYVSKWVIHWDHERAQIASDSQCELCRDRKLPVDLRTRVRVVA